METEERVEVKKAVVFAILSFITILFTVQPGYAIVNEETVVENIISRRMSIRSFLTTAVPFESLSHVLWAAHQYPWLSTHSIIIYISNVTATYRLAPSSSSLTLWKSGDYRALGEGAGTPTIAPYQLYIVYDKNIGGTSTDWNLWANVEAAQLIQNIYLEANALNLGTVCQYIRTNVTEGLGLPANEYQLYKMPLGYCASPCTNYTNLVMGTRPSSATLPMVQDSTTPFVTALGSLSRSRTWGSAPVTSQETSQMLWAGYGYCYYQDTSVSPARYHRTVPSAHNYYPMKVYAVDSSGIHEYVPSTHSLTTIVAGDKRSAIATASGNSWAASAPVILVMTWYNDGRQWLGGEETYVEAGLMAQNCYLEGRAWGLLVDFGEIPRANDASVRTAMEISDTNSHAMAIITMGHSTSTLQGNWYVNDVLITSPNQVVHSTTTTVSFKFVKTAGPDDSSVTCSVTEAAVGTLALTNSAAGTWTGSYTFTQGTHTLTLTATDGTTTITMSVLSDLEGTLLDPLIIIVVAAILLTVVVFLIARRKKK